MNPAAAAKIARRAKLRYELFDHLRETGNGKWQEREK